MCEFLDLSKYTKQNKIGQGSFGEVFKVLEESTGNVYAAKISLSQLDESDKKFNMNLRREVSILSHLNHPSVLKFIGYNPKDFNCNCYPVIITEYSVNGSLEDIIEKEHRSIPPESWSDTKKLINIYGIASAMSYLHSLNIIHRDLKPANILEDENLYPKIADFGLSKIYHQNIDSMTSQSTVGFKGTYLYTAPEIWHNFEYSKAGDVYAFSLIFYELFSNEKPFQNYDIKNLYTKVVMNGERPELNFPLPNCYKNLIEKCWSADPENRLTFDEIVQEIRNNKEFLIDTIDESEFLDYVDSIDEVINAGKQIYKDEEKSQKNSEEDEANSEEEEGKNESSGEEIDEYSRNDSDSEIGEKINENYEEEIGKISEIETDKKDKEDKYDIITIEEFNNFTIEKQYQTINNIIHKRGKKNKPSINKIHELLKYINTTKKKTDIKYLSIINENKSKNIEEHLESKIKICLSEECIKLITEESTFLRFSKYLKDMNNIFIELEYPSNTFEEIYSQALKLKEEDQPGIYLNIYINKINQTDYKFINNKHIYSIRIGKDVTEITGGKVEFRRHGGGSFSKCTSLKQVIIPSTVTTIGNYSFFDCSSLKEISIPSSITSISEGCFSSCTSLASTLIPSTIKSIKTNAFFGCKSLGKITFALPSSLTEIEKYAFYECSSLIEIIIPPSVTKIGDFAFSRCPSIAKISIRSPEIEMGDSVSDKCKTITICNDMTKIHDRMFAGGGYQIDNPSLIQITIPSSVTQIGSNAFCRCSSLQEITIPSSVTSIEECAFYECSSLTQITIPSSVTKIRKYAFWCCTSLKRITIPSSVTIIEEGAFCSCTSLTQIAIPSSVTKIEESVFSSCTSLTHFTIHPSVTYIGRNAFCICLSLTEITIPSSITIIEIYTFDECKSLKQIVIPSSVTIIGDCAFRNCILLTQITIPSSVTKIGNSAFEKCTSLKQIAIPSTVTQIEREVFSNCTSLTQILIPSSVTKISENVFDGCTSLTQITIPSSVTYIGEYAFNNCTSLTQIIIPPFVTIIEKGTFSNCNSLTQITIPSSVTKIGPIAFSKCELLEKILFEIPSSIIEIREDAFCFCTSLTQIAIPASVNKIYENAFKNCTSLSEISIPSSISQICENAFDGCQNEKIIEFFKEEGKTFKPQKEDPYFKIITGKK